MHTPADTRNQNYRRLRAQLVRRGTSLAAWARRHGYRVSTVYDAARGTRRGPVAASIVRRLEETLGRENHTV